MKHIFLLLWGSAILLSVASCNKILDAGVPQTALAAQSVFTSPSAATSALLYVYSQVCAEQAASTCACLGQASDELVSYYESFGGASVATGYYLNTLTALSGPDAFWGENYSQIYAINRVVEGVSAAGFDSTDNNQILGEAYFLRAFQYFYLVNLYGDVPYTTTSDYTVNQHLSRTPRAQVYSNIVSDLLLARKLLSNNYPQLDNQPGGQRIRANQAVVTAFLARVYLYLGDWTDAQAQASAVLSNTTYSLESNLNNVFLINSNEILLEVQPLLGTGTGNGPLSSQFILNASPVTTSLEAYTALGAPVLNSFDAGDQRKTAWVGTYSNATGTWQFPYKYKANQTAATTEYAVVLRLAEQYLIRAEALARQNQVAAAVQDINTIRQRAGAPLLSPNMDLQDCLAAIAKERQSELFTEWGDRWLDLKRTGQSDAVLSGISAKNWQATDTLFPIPLAQIQLDPNLTQNTGY